MKNKFITCLMLVAFGFLPIIVNAACTYSNQGDAFKGDVGKSSSGDYGTGKMFYIDAFDLKDNVLTMSGFAYLKGWTNIVSDGGNLNEYCYTKDGGGYEQGQYQKNVTYKFQLYSKSRQVSLPVPSENIKYDHWSGDLFRSTCPFYNGGYNCYWKMSKLQRNNYLTPHYRGGFKIDKFDIKAAVEKAVADGVNVKTADDYALQIKIKVTNVNNSKGFADWRDIECSPGKACSDWIDFHGYVSPSESRGVTSDNVYLTSFNETKYGHSMANRAHPKRGTDSNMTHCSGVMLEANNTSKYTILDRSTFYIKGMGYSGYKIKTNNNCSSGTVKPGSNDYNINIPAMWLEVSGSLEFHIGVETPPPFNYTSQTNQLCSDVDSNYPIMLREDRLFLMETLSPGNRRPICESISSGGRFTRKNSVDTVIPSIATIAGGEYDKDKYELSGKPIISHISITNEVKGLDDYLKKYSKVLQDGRLVDVGDRSAIHLSRSSFGENSIEGSYIIYNSYNNGQKPNPIYLEDGINYVPSAKIDNALLVHDLLPDKSGLVVEPKDYVFDGDNNVVSMSLDVTRTYRADTILAANQKKLCNADGSLNDDAIEDEILTSASGLSTLLQPVIVNIAYCAKEKTTHCDPNYNPDIPECKVQTSGTDVDNNKGSFYETDEAHVCLENFDNVSETVGTSGFKIQNASDNKYCDVVCLDDIDMELPGKKAAYSGTYFNLDLYDGAGVGPKITMKRSCYAKIATEEIYNDIANDPIQTGESEEVWKNRIQTEYINKINKCFSFTPGLYSNNSNPDVKFKYEDEEFKDDPMFKNQILTSDLTSDSGETVISKTTSESISSKNLNDSSFNDTNKYNKESNISATGISCSSLNPLQCTYTINGTPVNIADIHYIKKTQTKTWTYSTKDYYVSIPTGNVAESSNDHSIFLSNNSVPVSLKTLDQTHNYSLTIEGLTDNTRRINSGSDLDEKISKDYNMFNNNDANSEYTCTYKIEDNIVKYPGGNEPKKVNFFYRTIDVRDPLPQSARNYGYNWTTTQANDIINLIKTTFNYQKLIGAEAKTTDPAEDSYKNSDHFSFRLTPSTMARIRDYNSRHHYDDNTSLYISDSDRENTKGFYYRSRLLDCLGKENSTDACARLGLEGLSNTTSNTSLIDASRDIIKAKNERFIE